MYEERVYRTLMQSSGLFETTFIEKETDLFIQSTNKFKASNEVRNIRETIINYIAIHPEFEKTLVPIPLDKSAPDVINHMIKASKLAEVGPMATVAGTLSHYLGQFMKDDDIMIENGGDIYLKSSKDKVIAIFAGASKLSNKVGLKIKATETPIGICTSAGKIGHSLSFGHTDAVVVISKDTLLADAVATSVGNKVKSKDDIKSALEFARDIKGILGVVIIVDEELGVWGDVELVKING